jgi:SPOR domain
VTAHEDRAEVLDTDSAVVQVETGTTWREALSARLHPADHRISDEDIFAILHDEGDGHTAAELCATSGVTVPMYCVWKSKYRQMDLDELRKTRRRERRRRYTVIGLTFLVATLSIGGIVVGLSWAVLSAFTGSTASPSATAAAASDVEPGRVSAQGDRAIAGTPATRMATIDPQSRTDAEATTAETGYRIQVAAADTEHQGRAMVAQLASAGYPAYMTRAVVDSKNVFRVRVGPFDALADAETIAATLRAAGYAGVWIAR